MIAWANLLVIVDQLYRLSREGLVLLNRVISIAVAVIWLTVCSHVECVFMWSCHKISQTFHISNQVTSFLKTEQKNTFVFVVCYSPCFKLLPMEFSGGFICLRQN